jgi:hypothetical protein
MHLRIGSKGDEVELLQERLAERGYDVGPVDGQFGPRTRQAVAQFQEEQGFDAEGVVSAETGEELEISQEVDFPEIEPERASFRQLIAQNPNYFGTYPELSYEQEVELTTDTSYEELDCVGYDPTVERLGAVISIKRDYGYKGGVCSDGSTEYVRFFIDRERDGTWEDLGVASTRVYDIPGKKPLSYVAALQLDEDQQLCTKPQLPRIRAILSWEDVPPAGKPGHKPVWGNRLEADIQIKDRDLMVGDLVDSTDIEESIIDGLDVNTPLQFTKQSLDTGALLQKYHDTSVPEHRAAFKSLNGLLEGSLALTPTPGGPVSPPTGLEDVEPMPGDFPPEDLPEQPNPQLPFDVPPEVDFDVGDVLDNLGQTAASTQYEELTCVGLERSTLTGVVTVKKPSGYSGGLCQTGSPEYVAFWEWDSSSGGWSHLGTTSVQVHDIPGMPSDGLDYAADLPVDLSHHRKPCGQGPSVVRIRAVLSWNDKPPASDPNFTPTWGNSLETRVHVPPGPAPRTDGRLAVGTVGDVVTSFVEQSPGSTTNGTATTSGSSALNGFTATDAPFGSHITITGAPDDGLEPAASGPDALKYRVSVRPNPLGASPGDWEHLTNKFFVHTYDKPTVSQPMTTDSDGFYTYIPGTINDELAHWYSDGDGIYELKVEAKRGDGTTVHTDVITYADGSTQSQMYVQLDNTPPEASINITRKIPAGSSSPKPAAECEFLNVGDTLLGEFTADDEHLHHYSLGVQPNGNGPANGADPEETTSPRVRSQGGGNGTWELETKWQVTTSSGTKKTKTMDRCGYTVHVHIVDNTITNNSHPGFKNHDSEGFCLLGEGEEVVESGN